MVDKVESVGPFERVLGWAGSESWAAPVVEVFGEEPLAEADRRIPDKILNDHRFLLRMLGITLIISSVSFVRLK